MHVAPITCGALPENATKLAVDGVALLFAAVVAVTWVPEGLTVMKIESPCSQRFGATVVPSATANTQPAAAAVVAGAITDGVTTVAGVWFPNRHTS